MRINEKNEKRVRYEVEEKGKKRKNSQINLDPKQEFPRYQPTHRTPHLISPPQRKFENRPPYAPALCIVTR